MDNAILNCNTATLQQICRMYFPKKCTKIIAKTLAGFVNISYLFNVNPE